MCGPPWPCPAARLRLAQLIPNDAGVRRLLGLMMVKYVSNFPDANPVDVYQRFLAWAPR